MLCTTRRIQAPQLPCLRSLHLHLLTERSHRSVDVAHTLTTFKELRLLIWPDARHKYRLWLSLLKIFKVVQKSLIAHELIWFKRMGSGRPVGTLPNSQDYSGYLYLVVVYHVVASGESEEHTWIEGQNTIDTLCCFFHSMMREAGIICLLLNVQRCAGAREYACSRPSPTNFPTQQTNGFAPWQPERRSRWTVTFLSVTTAMHSTSLLILSNTQVHDANHHRRLGAKHPRL